MPHHCWSTARPTPREESGSAGDRATREVDLLDLVDQRRFDLLDFPARELLAADFRQNAPRCGDFPFFTSQRGLSGTKSEQIEATLVNEIQKVDFRELLDPRLSRILLLGVGLAVLHSGAASTRSSTTLQTSSATPASR